MYTFKINLKLNLFLLMSSLQMTPLPNSPWEQVSIDFCEVAGHYALVVIDEYSRFPEIEIVTDSPVDPGGSAEILTEPVPRRSARVSVPPRRLIEEI